MALDRITQIDRGGINTTSNYTIGAADIGNNIQLGNAGVITATSFSGNGSGLIGVASTDNIITGTAATFNTYPVDINAGMTVAGVATFAGNISIAGTLTYEDVTNIDSIGIITARSGVDVDDFISVGSNIHLGNAGVVTATTFSGSGASLTSIPAGNLTGTVADARISTLTASKLSGALPAISGANLTNLDASDLSGVLPALDGAALTNLDASDLASGTVPDARFPATLPAASGANLTSLPAAQLSGTAAAINGSNITNLNASNIASGTVPTARLGSGTANSSTFLAGDSTFKTVTGTTINNNADNRIITGSGTANTLNGESTLTYDGTNLDLGDSKKIRLGASQDFEIYHDGSETKLQATGSGNITILAETPAGQSGREIRLRNDTGAFGFGMDGNGELVPASNGSNGIGSPTRKFYRALVNSFIGDNADIDDFISVGSNIHLGNAGIVTATSYRGDGSQLTGISGGVTSDAQENTVGGTNAGDAFDGTEALENTLFGYDAGTDITTGDYNTAFGATALPDCTTGYGNVAIGRRTFFKVTTGYNNTGAGFQAGEKLTTGYRNVAIGSYSLYKATTSNDSVAIGNAAMNETTTGDENVAVGGGALHENQTGEYNVAIGHNALTYSHNSKQTALGYKAGYNSNGEENVYIGYKTGYSQTTANYNTAVGSEALLNATTATQNVAVGRKAAQGLTTGGSNGQNTAVGMSALFTTQTGEYNVAIGSNALALGNVPRFATAVGVKAGYVFGSHRGTFIGYQAGEDNTGSFNTYIGDSAFKEATSGTYNTAVGQSVGGSVALTGSNNTLLGHNAQPSSASVSNEITLGDGNVTRFRIPGIGVTFASSGNNISGITTFSKSVHIPDAVASNDYASLYLGTGNDVRFFHNGQHTFWQHKLGTPSNGGNLYIDSYTTTYMRTSDGSNNVENAIVMNSNGSVDLYHSGTKKLETTSGGVSIDGQLDLTSHLDMGDNDVVKLGDGDDLQLYHDGSNSFIKNYVGDLFINANDQEKSIACVPNGAVELYHDNSRRLRTYSGGVKIASDSSTGRLVLEDTDGNFAWQLTGFDSASSTGGRGVFQDANGGVVLDMRASGGDIFCYNNLKLNGNASADNLKLVFGAGSDFEIFHDGTTNRFQSNGLKNFQFNPKDTDVGLKIIGDGACELYHDGTKKLETSSAGITVTGTVDSASDVILKENIKTIDNALDKVTKLRGVEYDYKENKKHSIGVIAQEVEEVLPELVNGSEQKSVAYGNIVAVLIEAIKEQNNQINKMKKEIEELKD